MNKNNWVLIHNGKNGYSITFKQDVNKEASGYNLIDIRRINKESQEHNLSIYFAGKKTKSFAFDNREEALKYLFKKYPFLEKLKGGLKK